MEFESNTTISRLSTIISLKITDLSDQIQVVWILMGTALTLMINLGIMMKEIGTAQEKSSD